MYRRFVFDMNLDNKECGVGVARRGLSRDRAWGGSVEMLPPETSDGLSRRLRVLLPSRERKSRSKVWVKNKNFLTVPPLKNSKFFRIVRNRGITLRVVYR